MPDQNGLQGIPDPKATATAKKAGLVNIALTIVCQQKVSDVSFDAATLEQREALVQAAKVHTKACAIVSELLDEWPTGTGAADLTISSAPPQQ